MKKDKDGKHLSGCCRRGEGKMRKILYYGKDKMKTAVYKKKKHSNTEERRGMRGLIRGK